MQGAQLPDERFAACSHAFLCSSDDALQTSRWVINNLSIILDLTSKKVKTSLQVASFSGSSAFTDVAVAIALASTGHFETVTYVAEHSTAAYLHAVGKAIQMSPEIKPVLLSGKLRFFAGDTDISRPTEDVSKELKAIKARLFDLLLFHRCLHRLASPTEATTKCVQTLLSSGGTAVVLHTIDDGMQNLRDQACQNDSNGEQILSTSNSRREYLDNNEFVKTASVQFTNCRVCPLADKLSIAVNVRPWADAADGWTKVGTDAMTHVLGVDVGGEDEIAWKLRAHMLPVFYQRSTMPTTSTIGVILIQSIDHPSSSKLTTSLETKTSSSSTATTNDPWWPNGKHNGNPDAFSNVGLSNWHVQRAAWRVPKGTRRPPPPPVEYEAVIEGLSAQRVRHFELPGWIGLTDLIDMYIDLWEMDY